jgi:signal transduction histidine kinase
MRGAGFSVDVAIAAATAVLGLVLVRGEYQIDGLDIDLRLAQVVQVIASLTLVVRRRWPVAVLVACLALSFLTPVPAAVVALHATGRYVVRPSVSAACVLGTLAVVGPVWATTPRVGGVPEFLLFATLALAPWLIGKGEWSAVQLRAQQAASAQLVLQQQAQEARQFERLRLAREMHDVVAHRISLIVLQTNILDAETEDAAVREGVNRIRTTGREALEEMREILGLLRRADVEAVAGSPELERNSLTGVDVLAQDARAVGQPVVVELALTPRVVPDQAERTAFRIVRESLTNAVRHAPGALTLVRLTEVSQGVHVVVVNDPPADPPTGLTTGGNGLRGLRERIALVGGSITAGPTPAGGFRVEAIIPRGAP